MVLTEDLLLLLFLPLKKGNEILNNSEGVKEGESFQRESKVANRLYVNQ